MTARPDAREAGFILVETIVAFLILVIALTVAVQTVSQAAESIRRSRAASSASLVAGEVLAARADSIAGPGSWTGQHPTGASWRLVARRLGDDGPQPLYALTLEVRPPGATAALDFRTFAIGVAPQ